LMELPEKWELSRLVVHRQEPIGFIVASLKGERIHIHRLVVKDSHRELGLGTALLRAMAETASRRSLPTLTLKVSKQNKQAIRFYLHLGFTETSASADSLELSVLAPTLLSRIDTHSEAGRRI